MEPKRHFTIHEAREIAEKLRMHIGDERFDLEDFRTGLDVELEHGLRDPETDVTHDDPLVTGKIALAHLREMPDYYRRLVRMEAEAEAEQADHQAHEAAYQAAHEHAVLSRPGPQPLP